MQIDNADDKSTTGYIGAMGGGRGSYIVDIKNNTSPNMIHGNYPDEGYIVMVEEYRKLYGK